MKHALTKPLILSCMLVSGLACCQNSFAQSGEDNKKITIRIKVTEDAGGKVKNIEKNYEVPAMTDSERREFIDKAVDSLGIDPKNRRSLSISVDDGNGPETINKRRRKEIIDHPEDDDATVLNWTEDFADNFDTEKFRSHMRNFEKEFKPKAKIMMRDMENFGDRMGEFWTREVVKPSTVRDLNIYANNPDNGILNVRFQAAQKGDISITITDTKGKEVGKKEIKDFSGEFVGQVDIRKNTKGTVFVTVIQNEDGATKRIVIP